MMKKIGLMVLLATISGGVSADVRSDGQCTTKYLFLGSFPTKAARIEAVAPASLCLGRGKGAVTRTSFCPGRGNLSRAGEVLPRVRGKAQPRGRGFAWAEAILGQADEGLPSPKLRGPTDQLSLRSFTRAALPWRSRR